MSLQFPEDRIDGSEPTAAERAATIWVARCDVGLSPAQEEDFRRWLAADPQHVRLFEEYDGTWKAFDCLRQAPSAELPVLATFCPEQTATSMMSATGTLAVDRPIRFRRAGALLAAAAALLLVGYVVSWRPNHFRKTVATEIGHFRAVSLPDGSLVELNTGTRVSVTFSPGSRRVSLEAGEAHFIVAKNPARPFIVEANGVAVLAVGTAFNVRLRPAAVEVLVTEGRVRVEDAAKGRSLLLSPASDPSEAAISRLVFPGNDDGPLLGAGQRAVVEASGSVSRGAGRSGAAVISKVAPDEIQRELAWKQHRLEFVSAPLADIVADFNRYNRRQLVIDDPQLAAKRFGGSFQANEPDRFVRMLCNNFPVIVEQRTDDTILRLAP